LTLASAAAMRAFSFSSSAVSAASRASASSDEAAEAEAPAAEPEEAVSGIVEDVDYYGHDTMLTIRLDEPGASVISLRHTGTAAPEAGAKVWLRVRGTGRWYPGTG
jgi:hypothetical protein